jgi:hypothetical protein
MLRYQKIGREVGETVTSILLVTATSPMMRRMVLISLIFSIFPVFLYYACRTVVYSDSRLDFRGIPANKQIFNKKHENNH